jgi:hypothetical protein
MRDSMCTSDAAAGALPRTPATADVQDAIGAFVTKTGV